MASEALNYDETSSDDEFDYYDDELENDSYDSSDENTNFSSGSRNFSINGRRTSNINRNLQPNKSSFLSGDVVWHKLPSNKDLISFFDCHLFEVCHLLVSYFKLSIFAKIFSSINEV